MTDKLGVKDLEQETSPRQRVESMAREEVKSLFEGISLPESVTLQQLQALAAKNKTAEFDAMTALSPTETLLTALKAVPGADTATGENASSVNDFLDKWSRAVRGKAIGLTEGKGDVADPVLHKKIVDEMFDHIAEARRTVGDELTLSLKTGEGESSADRVSNEFLRHLGFLSSGLTIEELMTHSPTVEEFRGKYEKGDWRTRVYRAGSDEGKWASVSGLTSDTLPGVKVKIAKTVPLKEPPKDYDVSFSFDSTALQKSVTPKIVSS